MVARQFGPYQLVRQIAVGGMAEIHLAKTRGIAGFEKYCALKMIHPNFAQDEQFIEMLIDEAKIAVALQHVNIAQTFDLGRVGETYYITMEYVDGADLYKLLRRGSEQDVDMPVDVAAFIAKEMATGLDYAHRKRDGSGHTLGIVHRDVSPQNVLISQAGEVKLVDFGIAKATMKARQTAVGVIKGKYYYMSPEQAWGDRLDHRSDIFSAGIVLYEMLTGQMLYLEEDLHKLLEMVRRASIAPPTTLRREIPPQLERIVMNALAKKPEDRYQSAGDLAADLERFLHTYSPVFTASKLAQHLRRALGDSGPIDVLEPPGPRDPRIATQSLDPQTYVTNRADIADENSVIFRVPPARPPTEPAPRSIASSTMVLPDDGDEIERTLITGEPVMEAMSLRRARLTGDADELGDYEPTAVEDPPGLVPSGQHEDEPPTLARNSVPRASPDDLSTTPQRRPGAPLPAALAAHTPTPAVSELRRPRQSRRTPARGVPPTGSVLQVLVGGPSAPMPRPARGAGAPLSDGVPGTVRDPAPTGAPTTPVPGRPPTRPPNRPPTQPPPLPPAARPVTPPRAVPLATPPAATAGQAIPTEVPPSVPGAGLPAHLAPYAMASPPSADAQYPFQPYGAAPQSFSRQMQAVVELDEVPPHYRLPSRIAGLVRVVSIGLVIAAAAIGVYVLIKGDEAAPPPSLLIESTPSAAEVTIDGRVLPDRTPARFATQRGARHEIVVALPGHKRYQDAVVVPDAGGQLRVFAFLAPQTVGLRVVTTPAGADVYHGDRLLGRTPLEVRNLTPGSIDRIEIRHRDFQIERRSLDWAGQEQLAVEIKLRK